MSKTVSIVQIIQVKLLHVEQEGNKEASGFLGLTMWLAEFKPGSRLNQSAKVVEIENQVKSVQTKDTDERGDQVLHKS
jgi:hypothetical protein